MELQGLEEKVAVVVGDNASSDETGSVIQAFVNKYPKTIVLQHKENLGPDENFFRCIETVNSPYFWMIGSDDLPKPGVLRQIVNLLEKEEMDLIYLRSEWATDIYDSNYRYITIKTITSERLSSAAFAKEVNVWVTFISGVIVNIKRLRELQPGINLKKYNNTDLIQLGWVLPLLVKGKNFRIIKEPALLATADNSGGYRIFQTFAVNLPRIAEEVCTKDSLVYYYIIRVLYWQYLPSLILAVRFRNFGVFTEENILEALVKIRGSWAYWLLLTLLKLKKPIVKLVYFPISILVKLIFLIK